MLPKPDKKKVKPKKRKLLRKRRKNHHSALDLIQRALSLISKRNLSGYPLNLISEKHHLLVNSRYVSSHCLMAIWDFVMLSNTVFQQQLISQCIYLISKYPSSSNPKSENAWITGLNKVLYTHPKVLMLPK